MYSKKASKIIKIYLRKDLCHMVSFDVPGKAVNGRMYIVFRYGKGACGVWR